MFATTVKARVFGGLVVKETALGAFPVVEGFIAFLSRVCQEVAPFTLFHWLDFPWDADGDLFAKHEVSGLENLFDLVSHIIMYDNGHGVQLSVGVFEGSTRP